MHPVLFEVGGFRLHSYGALAAMGFVYVCWILLSAAEKRGWNQTRIVDLLFYPAIAGLVGARALYLLANPSQFGDPSTWLDVRSGGMVFYGAVLTGVPTAFLVARWSNLPMREVFDVFATALPVGHGISRIGCVLAGCCYGMPMDGFLGVRMGIHPLSVAPDHPVFPIQIVEAALLFALGAYLTLRERRQHFDGQILLMWLGLYAVIRFGLEFFRADVTRGWVLESVLGQTVSTSQGVSVSLLAAVWVLWSWWSRAPGSATGD